MHGTVLCLTSNFPRWAGDNTTPFVQQLCEDTRRAGWDVHVLAPHAPGAARAETLDGTPVERFRYVLPESAQTVCYGGGALINLRDRRTEYLKLPALVAAEFAATVTRLRSGRYDVLHSHWVLPQGLVGTLAAGRVPHVLSVHGSDVFALRSRPLLAAKRRALEGADVVTVNSAATEEAVRATAPGVRRVVRIPMGVDVAAAPDPALADQLRSTHRRPGGPLLAFVGRVVREKGLEDLVDAVAILAKEIPDLTVMVIGEGQDRAAIQDRARAAGVGDRIAFLGWVAPQRLASALAAADVFVLPSWHEGQGLSAIEAQVAGLPVVATRVGGLPEAVVDGETGLLVPPREPGALAEALRALNRSPELAARLAAAGREQAVRRFSRAQTAASFTALYAELVAARRATR